MISPPSPPERAATPRVVSGLGSLLLLAGLLGCFGAGNEPPELCLSIEASINLNLFDGQPHVVVLYLYPLQNVMAFRSTDAVDLLDSARPPGMTGDRWETTILPGDNQQVRETLPRDTQYIGVLADFYGGPSKEIVEAQCPTFGRDTLVLTRSDLQIQ